MAPNGGANATGNTLIRVSLAQPVASAALAAGGAQRCLLAADRYHRHDRHAAIEG